MKSFPAAALLLFSTMALGTENVFVDVRPEAVVDQPQVVLRDIARVAARDSALAEQVGALVVGRCTSLSGGCRFEMDAVAGAIEARAAAIGANLIWGANRGVAVVGLPKAVSLDSAIDRGAVWLVQTFAQGAPVYVDVVGGPTSVTVPPGVVTVRPEISRMRRVGASLDMPVRVLVDGVDVAQPQVRYLMRRTADTHDGHSGTQAGRFDAMPFQAHAIAGSEPRVAVAKDQRVRLLIDAGPVRVEAEGVAMGDAKVGGTVKVRRANGLAAVTGRAVDQGTVQVVEN